MFKNKKAKGENKKFKQKIDTTKDIVLKSGDHLKEKDLVDYIFNTELNHIDNEGTQDKSTDQTNKFTEKENDDTKFVMARNGFEQLTITKKFNYKRISYFMDQLNKLQAQESKIISKDILVKIDTELKKRGETFSDLNNVKLRQILKKINEPSYYVHIPRILCITQQEYINIPDSVQEELKSMFMKIQEPFDRYRGECRTNFLNYKYIFYKFFELLEYTDYLEMFPLIQPQNLKKNDAIWKKICQDVGFTFIPTKQN